MITVRWDCFSRQSSSVFFRGVESIRLISVNTFGRGEPAAKTRSWGLATTKGLHAVRLQWHLPLRLAGHQTGTALPVAITAQ
jgi:hypothetical protein